MTTVAMISAAKRNALPAGKFALPDQRKYPIDTAARVRNAAARLEGQKGSMPEAQYKKARTAIAAAAKRFGIESEYNRKAGDVGPEDVDQPGPMKTVRRPGLHMRIGTDGSIEVRHNADAGDPLYGETVALADAANDNAAPVWIQIAKVGQFAGHPAGPFRLDAKAFNEIVANFKATENKRIPIDFEHASEADATDGSIPSIGAPAQGWIVDLDNRGDAGLWALVEWGDKAREYIRAGQYRYISPAVRFNSRDRVTGQAIGARLTSAGLTNQPFLDGMQPLAAKDGLGQALMPAGDFMHGCRAALSLHELATHTECKDQLDRLRGMCEMADDPMGIHEGVDLGGYVTRCNGLMNMPAHATIGELFDAVEEMIDAAIARHEAEYHEDAGPASESGESMSAMADPTEEAAMADINLKDIEAKLDEAARNLKDEQAKREAAEAKAAEATLKMKELDAGLIELRAAQKKRDEEDAKRVEREQEAEVDNVLAVYADKKGLAATDRPELLTLLRAAPDAFHKLYPPVAPSHRHLMRDLTGKQLPAVPATLVNKVVTMAQRRPDVPNFEAPLPAPTDSPEGLARGRALKALAGGASLEHAILMANRTTNSAAS
jgi:hypothetical protein